MARAPKMKIEPEVVVENHPSKRFMLSPILILSVLFVGALAVAGYFYYQYRHTSSVKDAEEIGNLTKEIGKLIVLPDSETPTLATVTDKGKLVDQPFFSKAENGDKVLIYSQSGRAILYRPSLKRIVDVTTVNIAPPAGSATSNATPPPSSSTTTSSPSEPSMAIAMNIRVAIYNGSGEAGAGAALEKQIHALYPDMTFSDTTDAAKSYDESRVIDLTGKNTTLAQAFANLVKGAIRTMPEGEKTPDDADVLIILGKGK